MRQEELCSEVAQRLARWFRAHARSLPWRQTRDPYAIWVSEVMLQQTRVVAVEEYYRRWLERFPTVYALAEADLDAVLKQWQGLGYYTRARNLHRAAQFVVQEYDGRLPQTADELQKLPGIGRYTAGAVASIAFGAPEPVVDGNVTRVLCRVFHVTTIPTEPTIQRRLWRLAGRIVASDAGMLNQAMMELGALICLPRQPRCPNCPVQPVCRACAKGDPEQLPLRPAKREVPHYDVAIAVIRRNGRVLIDRRPPQGHLGGLWEFPGGKLQPGESVKHALVREAREEVALTVEPQRRLATVEHAYTHFRVTLHAFECRVLAGRARPLECDQVKWVALDDLDDYAFPRGSEKIIDILLRDKGTSRQKNKPKTHRK